MISLYVTDPLQSSALDRLRESMGTVEPTLIAMSGGVDSSVSAVRATQLYANCVGITLIMQDTPHQVPAQAALDRALKTCAQLKIPHITYNVSASFYREIIEQFADGYSKGCTPNPCILCNPLIKFGKLLEVADLLKAKQIITGHYAHITRDATGTKRLKRAANSSKDQSYFMYRITPNQLNRVVFLLGEAASKDEIRQEAHEHHLPSAQAPDSMDVCFLEHEDRLELIKRIRPQALVPGALIDKNGVSIGTHQGIARVTVGQRKGLAYAGGKRLYVRHIDADTNTVQLADQQDLDVNAVTVRSMVWHTVLDPHKDYRVQLRYRSTPIPCTIEAAASSAYPDQVTIHLSTPYAAVAPGQSAVIYDDDDLVVGGGFISDVTFVTSDVS